MAGITDPENEIYNRGDGWIEIKEYADSASYITTWRITASFASKTITSNDQTITFSPPSLSYIGTCPTAKQYYHAYINGYLEFGYTKVTDDIQYEYGYGATSTTTRVQGSFTRSSGSSSYTVNTSDIFTTYNNTLKTIKVNFVINENATWEFIDGELIQVGAGDSYTSSAVNSRGTGESGYWFDYPETITNVSTITLNDPPTVSLGTVSIDTDTCYAGVSKISVDVSALAKYGGNFSSGDGCVELLLTNKATGIVTSSQKKYSSLSDPTISFEIDAPDAGGTYKVTAVATDSRGQVTTSSSTEIDIEPYDVVTTISGINRVLSEDQEPEGETRHGIADDQGENAEISIRVDYPDVPENYLLEPDLRINDELCNQVEWYESWGQTSGFSDGPIDFSEYDPDTYDDTELYEGNLYALSKDTVVVNGRTYYTKNDGYSTPSRYQTYGERFGTLSSGVYTLRTIDTTLSSYVDNAHPLKISITPCVDLEIIFNRGGANYGLEICDYNGVHPLKDEQFTLNCTMSGYTFEEVKRLSAYMKYNDVIYSVGYIDITYDIVVSYDNSRHRCVITHDEKWTLTGLDFSEVESATGWTALSIANSSGLASSERIMYTYYKTDAPTSKYLIVSDVQPSDNPVEENWYITVPRFVPPVTLYGWIKEEFSTDTSYNIGVTGKTFWKNSIEATDVLTQAFYLLSAKAGGHGLGVGTKPKSNDFYVDMDAYFYGDVMAYGIAGSIQMYAGYNIPKGWLLCDGSSLLIDEYPELAAALYDETREEYIYGSPDSVHFYLPDMRDRMPVGTGDSYAPNAKGGSQYLQEHTHSFTPYSLSGGYKANGIGPNGAHTHVFSGNDKTVNKGSYYMRPKAHSSSETTVNAYGTSSSGSQSHSTPNHTHTLSGGAITGVTGLPSGQTTGTEGNMPPYIGLYFIIATGRLIDVITEEA